MSDEAEPVETPTFTDTEGREWLLRITCGHTTEILETCGIDLSISKLAKAYEIMSDDLKKFVQVLWILIEQQAEVQGVSPADFAKSLDGEAVSDAMEAIDKAVVNFTPRRMRPAASKIIEAATTLSGDIVAEIGKKIDTTMKNRKALVEKTMRDMDKNVAKSPSNKR
jgi:hypothetical protein